MAKKSSIARNLKRKHLIEKYAPVRAELKLTLKNPKTTNEEFFKAQRQLAGLPRNSSSVRYHNRCSMSGRSRGYMRYFGLSRIAFRELAGQGLIPGVTRSSW